MLRELSAAVRLLAATIVICAFTYPLLVLAIAAVAARRRLGSLIADGRGRIVGSRLIAQRFEQPGYLWPRPSACDYNAAAAGGSNLSPASPRLRERAEVILARLKPAEQVLVPAELLTASGSGLDPHLSLAAARMQAGRIAESRQVQENEVVELIEQHARQATGGTLGEERLANVLELNLLFDRVFPKVRTSDE